MIGDESEREKKIKSFSLKRSNARKVEVIAFDKNKKQSAVVDEMIEEFEEDEE